MNRLTIAVPLLLAALPARAQDAPQPSPDDPPPQVGNCRPAQGDAAPKLPSGPKVTVSGTIQAPEGDGQILIEVMDEKKGAEGGLFSIECLESGPFEVELARSFGKVRLVGFFETGDDGPTSDDPAALSKPLDLSGGDVDGVVLKIVPGFDLGRFAPRPPGTPPPAPPPGAAKE